MPTAPLCGPDALQVASFMAISRAFACLISPTFRCAPPQCPLRKLPMPTRVRTAHCMPCMPCMPCALYAGQLKAYVMPGEGLRKTNVLEELEEKS